MRKEVPPDRQDQGVLEACACEDYARAVMSQFQDHLTPLAGSSNRQVLASAPVEQRVIAVVGAAACPSQARTQSEIRRQERGSSCRRGAMYVFS